MYEFCKKFFVYFVVFAVLIVALGAVNVFTTSVDNTRTYKNAYRWTGRPKDLLLTWAEEVEDRIDGTTGNQSFYFSPTDTVPTATEGRLYYNNTGNALTLYTGSAWETLDTAGGVTLDEAYDKGGAGSGRAITVNDGAVALSTTDADAASVLTVTHSGAADGDGITITVSGSSQDGIEFENTGTGMDIEGTGALWTVAKTGVGTFAGIDVGGTDIILENDEKIMNDTDHEIQFSDNGTNYEDISLVFGNNNNTISLATDTGATTLDFGVIDKLTSVESITTDAEDFELTLTADGAGEDLIINQAGAVDASIVLNSAGTGTDAIWITADKGVTIDANDDLKITNTATTTADDFVLTQAGAQNASLLLTSGGTGTDALSLATTHSGGDIKINSSDMLDIDAADDISIDLAGAAGEDIMVTNTGGSILIRATEADACNIYIESDGGTADVLTLHADQGTGVAATTETDASIMLLSDAGGIGMVTNSNLANAIRIETNGGATETLAISAVKGTGVASIDIDSTVGGVTISANAAGKDINIDSVLGSIYIVAEENDACAIWIEADGGTTSAVRIHNDTGTAASATTQSDASIQLLSDVGGIGLYSALNNSDAIRIEANGGANETVAISSVKGTGAASIDIDSTVGGVTISANAAGKDINIDSVLGSIYIVAEENDACAIWIESDGGTASGLRLHNDTGTASSLTTESDASIQLLSDVGGIGLLSNLNNNDAIRIEANGGTGAGITIQNAQGTDANSISLVSAGGITLNPTTGGIICSGDTVNNLLWTVEAFQAAHTLTADESGKLCISEGLDAGAGNLDITLPTAAAGLFFYFADCNAQAADDLRIRAAASDTINGGTANKYYAQTNDAGTPGCMVIAQNATNWIVIEGGDSGTWANDNS